MTENKVLGNINIFSDEGRCRVDVGWIWGGCGVDLGWMWGGCRVDVGRMWGGCRVDVEWLWFPHGLCINSRV